MSNVIVTGGAGFIGSHLVDKLILLNHDVLVIDNLSTGDQANINPKASFSNTDVCGDISEWDGREIDFIFHLAAQINLRNSFNDPITDARNNILGTLNMIQLAKKHKAKIIFSSTGGAIYSPNAAIPWAEDAPAIPESPYGISKLAAEHYLRVGSPGSVILRLANVYGPRQNPHGEAGVIAIFLDRMLKGQSIKVFGTGFQTRDFVYVDDVVEAFILGMKKNVRGVFNVSTNKTTSVNMIVQILNKLTETRDLVIESKPAIAGELEHSALDYRKIKAKGWHPLTPLQEGLNKTVAHYL
jgi:UDP-glucose 4-epimerase